MKFKFFHTPFIQHPIEPLNSYLGFDMDIVLLLVIEYKRRLNLDFINSSDTLLTNVNVPINNCWLRIVTWRTITEARPEMLEIDYTVFEANTPSRDFTMRMATHEFCRRLNIHT